MPPRPRPRDDLAELTPYRSSDVKAGRILLHANENPYPPPEAVREELLQAVRDLELNRYPPAGAEALKEAVAGYAGVDPSWIFVGDGSNEVLLQACLAYGGPGRHALLFEPTYRMQHRQARIAGTEIVEVRRGDGFAIDLETARAAIGRKQPHIVFVCTPNNPTGTLTPRDDLVALARSTDALVVVDEAYHEFCGETIVGDLPDLPNVLVVRTLSKAFRLAGIRLGYGIAHPDVLEPMERVRMPYGQSTFTQIAATAMLRHRDEVMSTTASVIEQRDLIVDTLGSLDGWEVFPSAANFVLFRPPDADGLLERLSAAGIVIRDFRTLPGCEGCLRVTAGTPDEVDAFLSVVRRGDL